jgi:hypothetical protein
MQTSLNMLHTAHTHAETTQTCTGLTVTIRPWQQLLLQLGRDAHDVALMPTTCAVVAAAAAAAAAAAMAPDAVAFAARPAAAAAAAAVVSWLDAVGVAGAALGHLRLEQR